jgi:hypothetical protein
MVSRRRLLGSLAIAIMPVAAFAQGKPREEELKVVTLIIEGMT